jgi:polyhydroxyalkanoate synthesis regulator phasin
MRKEHMSDTDLKIRIERQENIFARCMVMIQQDIDRLQEQVRELEERVDVLLSVG